MSKLVAPTAKVPAMSQEAIADLQAFQTVLLQLPQAEIATHHVLHGGMYTRTIKLAKGVFIVGALVKVPTTLIVNGDCTVNLGGEPVRLTGYCVIPASAQRKQAFVAHEDTYLTMSFRTNATTVMEAEDEFTDEATALLSRLPDSNNEIIITGE